MNKIRKIKFRAVLDDKEVGIRIVDVQSIDWFEKKIVFNDGFGVWSRQFSTVKALLRYTGKKSKKDQEIYEGDIVKHKDGLTYKVSYCNINCWWYLEGLHNSLKGQDMRLHMCIKIGNMYQNPELIK